MLTSHKLLQQYWHDSRYDTRKVRIWYIDHGAPGDRSSAFGTEISLEPYYFVVYAANGEKPVPYQRILLITYDGIVEFENRKVAGMTEQLIDETRS